MVMMGRDVMMSSIAPRPPFFRTCGGPLPRSPPLAPPVRVSPSLPVVPVVHTFRRHHAASRSQMRRSASAAASRPDVVPAAADGRARVTRSVSFDKGEVSAAVSFPIV